MSEPPAKLPFERLGPYQILRPLAIGGMAELYIGRKTGEVDSDEPVVLKVWHPPTQGHDSTQGRNLLVRLVEEGRLGMRLTHPSIARSFGVHLETTHNVYYLVQEFVLGTPLSDLIDYYAVNDLKLPYNIILHAGISVLKGLHYAYFHALREDARPLRVVHRDIKPENILLSYTGRIRIVDFGVARSTSLTREATGVGIVIGTRFYMAPEQVFAPERVGHRSDLFSLALVLYELLTLEPVFKKGNSIKEFASALAQFDFAPLEPRIDERRYPGMGPILARALRPNPDDRFASAEEMAEELTHLLERAPKEPTLEAFARQTKADYLEAGMEVLDLGKDASNTPSEEDLIEQPTIIDLTGAKPLEEALAADRPRARPHGPPKSPPRKSPFGEPRMGKAAAHYPSARGAEEPDWRADGQVPGLASLEVVSLWHDDPSGANLEARAEREVAATPTTPTTPTPTTPTPAPPAPATRRKSSLPPAAHSKVPSTPRAPAEGLAPWERSERGSESSAAQGASRPAPVSTGPTPAGSAPAAPAPTAAPMQSAARRLVEMAAPPVFEVGGSTPAAVRPADPKQPAEAATPAPPPVSPTASPPLSPTLLPGRVSEDGVIRPTPQPPRNKGLGASRRQILMLGLALGALFAALLAFLATRVLGI